MKHLYWAAGTGILLHIGVVLISGLTRFHWSDIAGMAAILVFCVLLFFSFSGEGLSVGSQAQANVESRGLHGSTKAQKALARWNPLLTGTLVYLIISFSFPYIFS
ncbi:hypothetical protein [Salipaludibacillus aurantiacus]|uniref:Uncharacterized protein n=1 Tax=Salipaludibacillus aurantiacus TaxID=1601833 RepID=A0A1H9S6U3_9BACI|nr:hypothetical protein [Salipaludibacillus aurantiacus]SER80345.1 hypothetical protein SAMN05518684_10441 [Salipaludibacillus aurantiacus]